MCNEGIMKAHIASKGMQCHDVPAWTACGACWQGHGAGHHDHGQAAVVQAARCAPGVAARIGTCHLGSSSTGTRPSSPPILFSACA